MDHLCPRSSFPRAPCMPCLAQTALSSPSPSTSSPTTPEKCVFHNNINNNNNFYNNHNNTFNTFNNHHHHHHHHHNTTTTLTLSRFEPTSPPTASSPQDILPLSTIPTHHPQPPPPPSPSSALPGSQEDENKDGSPSATTPDLLLELPSTYQNSTSQNFLPPSTPRLRKDSETIPTDCLSAHHHTLHFHPPPPPPPPSHHRHHHQRTIQ